MQGTPPKRTFTRDTLARVWGFARPHKRALAAFLLLSVAAAVLTVATPILAGWVVDEIVGAGDQGRIVVLALLIAGLALVDAGVGLAERWQSAKIGEGIILDLRRAVFGHVQRMPVAFFTRTRTGALVSRLNNDVIGAQRAFTWTLSGVVSNLIALLLTLAVMLSLSWQITLLALVLLPLFVVPARRIGRPPRPPGARGGRSQRRDDDPDDRAVLGPRGDAGQAVRPARPGGGRVRRPGRAGGRDRRPHRDGPVRLPHRAGAGVGAGPGAGLRARRAGWRSTAGWSRAPWSPSRCCSPSCYAPLTALASARVDAMTALVSFERVFEVLDLPPLIAERPDPHAGARRAGFRRVRRRPVRLPGGRQGVAGVAGGGRHPRHPGRGGGAARRLVPGRSGPAGGAGGVVGRRQVDDRVAGTPALRRRRGRGAAGRGRRAGPVVRRHPERGRAGDPGRPPVPRHGPREPALRPARGDRRRAVGRAAPGPAGAVDRVAARRARHGGGRAGLPVLGRRAPTTDDRPDPAGPAPGGDPRRGDRPPRLDVGGRGPGRARPTPWPGGPPSSSPTACRPSGTPTPSS